MRDPRTPLESALGRLPEPEPPAGMHVAVMARVALVDEARRAEDRQNARDGLRGRVSTGAERSFRGRTRLATALGASGLGGYLYGLAQGAWTFDPLASPVGEGIPALGGMPGSVSAALGLTAALLLYMAGLLAPLGRDSVSRAPRRSPHIDPR